jgi:hypothetical protein
MAQKKLTNLRNFLSLKNGTLTMLVVLAAASAQGQQSKRIDDGAQKILDRTVSQMKCQSETNNVKMSIIDADGSKKDRQIELKRLTTKSDQRVLARLMSPPDLRGMAFLSVVEKGGENQWVYLPSSKQTRHVVGVSNKDSGILGSDLTYEDLNPGAIRSSQAHWVNNGSKTDDVIEVRLAKGKSVYSRALFYVDKNHSLPLKIEYFDWHNHAVKSIAFRNYQSYGGVWRAQNIEVQNLATHRRTVITINDVKINAKLSREDFMPQALGDE